jgi:hypothetical protein
METLISGVASFFLFHVASHPKSKINKKLSKITPSTKIKRVELFPRFNIEAKNRRFYIHHWMLLAPLFVVTQTLGKGILQSDMLHGFMLGGIVQGLLYKDSLKFIHHNKDYYKKITATSYHRLSTIKKILN